MTKRIKMLAAALLLGVGVAFAQQRVSGTVLDQSGQPLAHASVRVDGTKIMVTTDEQGRFLIPNVPASARRLTFSYFGYDSKTVDLKERVEVTLKEKSLGEAVVMGYGKAQQVGTVVGSVKSVSGQIVEGKPALNIADALQGQVAGMQVLNSSGEVGSLTTTSITIRGVGSLGAGNTPLIVVDGTPVGSAMLSLLNDADIESITTLKDASATSIYGSRAANGVIYITTKKGTGREGKAIVKVGQKIGWSQLARKIGNPMSADELLDFQLENGIIYPENYARYKEHGSNTDWNKYFFRKDAPMYSTDFSIQGQSDRTRYMASGSYMKQAGIVAYSNIRRYTVRTNLETQALDWMKFGIQQHVSYDIRQTNGYTRNGSNNLYSYSTAAVTFPRYWDPYDEESAANHMIWGQSGVYNNKWLLSIQPAESKDIVYQGNAFMELSPVKGLTLRSQLGLYATDTRSSMVVYPSVSALFGMEGGEAGESHGRSSQWIITNTAEYSYDFEAFGMKQNLTVLAGQEGIKYDTNSFAAYADGILDDRFLGLAFATGSQPAGNVSDSWSKYEYLSFFGRLDYQLGGKYFANLTVRNDASSRFGRTNRNATFVSGGVMWNAKAEEFLRYIDWLDDLQVKFSVGSTGNSDIGNYEHLGLTGTTTYHNAQGYYMYSYASPELGWEKQIQTNVGISATFLHRLHLDFNFYNRKTKDMLLGTPQPYTTGVSSKTQNIGEMTNRGVEVEFSADIVKARRQGDWNLRFSTTYAYNTNKIDELFYGLKEWPMPEYLINYIVGSSLNYYMPIYAGVDKEDGAPMWYKKGYRGKAGHTFNPETMTKDATQLDDLYQDTGKSRYAPHTGGFGLQVQWKGLTIQADFSYVLGKYMVNNAYFIATSSSSATSGYNMDKDALKMWKKPGDEALLPAFKYDSEFDTHLLENSSFLRLKNLSVTYDLPTKWMQATKFIQNVRFNFTGRNIFTVTNYSGADPEVDSNLTLGNYPASRQFTLGVEVTF